MIFPPPATTWLFVRMTPDGSTITPEPALATPGCGSSGMEGECPKNWRNSGLFLNRSPKGVPLNPNGISSELSFGEGFRSPDCGTTTGVCVIVTTDGNTLLAAS